MKLFIMLLMAFICLENSLFAQRVKKDDEILFAGTMLSYTALNVPPEHLAFEQFFLCSRTYGQYDNNSKLDKNKNFHQYELLPYVKFGIVEDIDLNVITSVVYSRSEEKEVVSVGDTLVLFGFQLMRAEKNSWMPDMRLLVGEGFPTGKYNRLDPTLKGADGIGTGAFETNFILSMAKVFPISKKHALRFNPNLYYIIPTSVDVADFSIYGGNFGTRGKVEVGSQFAFDFPIEFNITKHLIVGMDIFYIYRDHATFASKAINRSFNELPSSENLSLAPCLEYNPSEKFGIEGGMWFSVSGRNSSAFTTGIFVAWWYF